MEFILYHSKAKGDQEGIFFIPCYALVGLKKKKKKKFFYKVMSVV